MSETQEERLKNIKEMIDRLAVLGIPQKTIDKLNDWLAKGAPRQC